MRGELHGGEVGFGWRLVAFDPATRTGEVALGARVLRFEAAAAADEDLRVGDEVFVRLLSSSPSEPHVARVWPCLARLSTPAGAAHASAPSLTRQLAADVERLLTQLPRADAVLATTARLGSLRLTLFDLDRNAYGFLGHDLTVHGALHCASVPHGPARELSRPVLIRIADAAERAWAHAQRPLTPETLVLALVDRRDELSPLRGEATVTLVTCGAVSWQPGPQRARVNAAEAAAKAAVPRGLDAVSLNDGHLVGRVGGRVERLLALTGPLDGAAFEPWCDAVSWLLRDAEDGELAGAEIAEALGALEQQVALSAAAFEMLPLPGVEAAGPAVLVPVLRALGALLDALAAWLESLTRAGVTIAPRSPVVPALIARIGRIAAHHSDLVRSGAPQSAAWHATIDLYTEYAYCGSTHGGGALLSRLHDGRPLRPGDASTLRALAARARAVVGEIDPTSAC